LDTRHITSHSGRRREKALAVAEFGRYTLSNRNFTLLRHFQSH
jgi:hypothetical protein